MINPVPIPGDAWRIYKKYPLLNLGSFQPAGRNKPVDFFRGPQDMLDGIEKNRPHRLSAELGLHIFEIIEALQYPEQFNYQRQIKSEFPAISSYV
ncbi:MAG: hypothetical protein QNJ60_09440 [Xenococcaceae cyanobacterium MO_188.B19]|nr:hypothetical protein [Xenococcaceae cyanobacterium MO_188.B19]